MKKLLISIFILFLSLTILPNTYALSMSWDRSHLSEDVVGYKVYLCSSYDKAEQLEPDVIEEQFVTLPCICCGDEIICQIDWDVYWGSHRRIFIAVTAIDSAGFESAPTIAYIIWGNIIGTYNDGTPYTEAELNEADITAFAANLGGTNISHQQINCDEEFSVIVPIEEQRCDFDKDGDVDEDDLKVLLPAPTSLEFQ